MVDSSGGASVSSTIALMTAVLGDVDEAKDLLALVQDMPKHWAHLAGDEPLEEFEVRIAMESAARRARGMPMQYAARRAHFRHLTLSVDERALIPRPETELLVDLVLEATRGEPGGVVADVGTGTGAVALALATEGRFAQVIATDVSMDALAVAAENADRYLDTVMGHLELRHGHLLEPVTERGLRAVVSNPPYIAYGEAGDLPPLVRDWEPSVALFAGDNGNAVASAIIRDAAPVLAPGGILALEVDTRRAAELAHVAERNGAYEAVRVVQDLSGRDRFVVAKRREDTR